MRSSGSSGASEHEILSDSILVPVVQNIISLTSSLMINSLTVVAKVCSNTLIFLLQINVLKQKTSM